jgi:hypothetical protein
MHGGRRPINGPFATSDPAEDTLQDSIRSSQTRYN